MKRQRNLCTLAPCSPSHNACNATVFTNVTCAWFSIFWGQILY
jgi:hypothetical protein